MLPSRAFVLTPVPHCFFFSSRRRHTRFDCDWSSDVCSSDLEAFCPLLIHRPARRGGAHAALRFGPIEASPDGSARGAGGGPPVGRERADDVKRSEERRVGKEGRSRWSPYH